MKIRSIFLAAAMFAATSSAFAGSTSGCLAAVKADLLKKWPDNKTVNIVAFGHSVPAGYFVTPTVNTREAYPRLVADGLAASYPTAVVNVITSAVGGENSSAGLARFKREALGHLPRVVTIDYGLNDRGLSIEQSRSNLTQMVHQAKQANACVVLVTATPDLGGDTPSSKSSLVAQVAMIRDLARAENVPVADAFAAFSDYRGDRMDLMAQPNHPNAKGHRLVADRILRLFK
ncbi:SGNH/GDSL hydrolase family protein [Xanthomonas prunicola]|uniref:SGNH/GDSL hydrolase family protein n=1 Tax=Xanthomonas prunicola TaxID=2053930 RepID=UPI0021B43335|nr:SGNH/GDSL hydrolase family protein [Xanthomonas prunicola]UXA53339.1 SGNH/GDSL hydrolase family protein [Xanthomonas prunicola]